jgi:hypothetical protein
MLIRLVVIVVVPELELLALLGPVFELPELVCLAVPGFGPLVSVYLVYFSFALLVRIDLVTLEFEPLRFVSVVIGLVAVYVVVIGFRRGVIGFVAGRFGAV